MRWEKRKSESRFRTVLKAFGRPDSQEQAVLPKLLLAPRQRLNQISLQMLLQGRQQLLQCDWQQRSRWQKLLQRLQEVEAGEPVAEEVEREAGARQSEARRT